MKFRNYFSVLTFGAALFLFNRTEAAPEVFTIDSSQSIVSLSGDIGGNPLSAQGPGSLTTSYSGNINADVSGSTIQFTGSSAIIAQTNGVWQPAVGGGSGSAAADYGGQSSISIFTIFGAARNIALDVTSPSLVLTGTNFDSSALIFSFPNDSTATLDFNAAPITSGSISLAGDSTNNTLLNGASLVTDGSTQKLTIQFNSTFTVTLPVVGDSTVTLSGQIVATNSVVTKPLIDSIALTGQNAVLKVENASVDSQLQSSTNLTSWAAASATATSNGGIVTFTAPISGPKMFFRVQQ